MPGHLPAVDQAALARLRTLVQEMHKGNGRSVPMRQLVSLATDVKLEAGMTIDFEASRQLGQPMVVLRVPARTQSADSLKALSRREREIVALIAEGLSNKQIARGLFIALATVKDHVHRILTKTGLPNRAALAAAHQGYDHTSPYTSPYTSP